MLKFSEKKIPKKTSRDPAILDINYPNFPFQITAEKLQLIRGLEKRGTVPIKPSTLWLMKVN
jgi:hypothetical protein